MEGTPFAGTPPGADPQANCEVALHCTSDATTHSASRSTSSTGILRSPGTHPGPSTENSLRNVLPRELIDQVQPPQAHANRRPIEDEVPGADLFPGRLSFHRDRFDQGKLLMHSRPGTRSAHALVRRTDESSGAMEESRFLPRTMWRLPGRRFASVPSRPRWPIPIHSTSALREDSPLLRARLAQGVWLRINLRGSRNRDLSAVYADGR